MYWREKGEEGNPYCQGRERGTAMPVLVEIVDFRKMLVFYSRFLHSFFVIVVGIARIIHAPKTPWQF